MAYWREDILRINGYDEAFEGWGSEDTEMSFRLINCGVQLAFLRFGAIQYHLYHENAKKENSEKNCARAIKSKQNKNTWCQRGVDQYLVKDRSKYLTVTDT
jgi:predicted glycosyltransferase involved in capsule biosynthesis